MYVNRSGLTASVIEFYCEPLLFFIGGFNGSMPRPIVGYAMDRTEIILNISSEHCMILYTEVLPETMKTTSLPGSGF